MCKDVCICGDVWMWRVMCMCGDMGEMGVYRNGGGGYENEKG